jgi:hypothetical protein
VWLPWGLGFGVLALTVNVTTQPSGWEIAGVFATFFVALATGFAAWQAMKAAQGSRATAEDAREALAIAMRPRVTVDAGAVVPFGATATQFGMHVINVGQYDAMDIETVVQWTSGQIDREHLPILKVRPSNSASADSEWFFAMPEDAFEDAVATFVSIVVRYSDSVRVHRYEYGTDFTALNPDGTAKPGRDYRIDRTID